MGRWIHVGMYSNRQRPSQTDHVLTLLQHFFQYNVRKLSPNSNTFALHCYFSELSHTRKLSFSYVSLKYTYSPVHTPLVCLAESDLTCPTSFHCSFRLASPYLQYAFNHSNPPHNPRSIKCCLNANSFCALIYPPLWFQASQNCVSIMTNSVKVYAYFCFCLFCSEIS